MPANDLPGTLDTAHAPSVPSRDAPQSTTASETEVHGRPSVELLDVRGYELIEPLGSGGMGDVYRAGDPALGRDLAIKVMKAAFQGHPSAERRFLREARVTGSLQHPGIVPVYNLGRLADGRLHYTMRLVRGRTLADILKEEAGRPEHLPALLTIFEKMCQAVAYAHSKRVIHRDLKPSNVMVGRFGEVQVMDWGLAKLLTVEDEPEAAEGEADPSGTRIHTEAADTPQEQTRMGREMGTPAYMPPEQALGEWDAVDERADVFALGAILCEILTGQPPYSGSDGMAALRKAKRGDCTEALTWLEGCGADAALTALCRACLAPAQEERPRDAEEVAQRVAAYQAEVQERLRRAELERAAAVVKVREERKRRRWVLAFLLLLLAGAAVSTWQAVRATQAEKQAQTRLRLIQKSTLVLTSIFHDLNPHAEEEGGPSLRQQLSQHLERAGAQLDDTAKCDDPLTAARMQSSLGHTLTELGRPQPAIEMLNKACLTFQTDLGVDHPETLACRTNLAQAYWAAGQPADAIRLDEETLQLRRSKLGATHPHTLLNLERLVRLYEATDQKEKAADYRKILDQAKAAAPRP